MSESLVLPRLGIRRRRKRPWSPQTKATLLNCVIDVDLLLIGLVYYPIDGTPFDRFLDFSLALLWAFMLRADWRRFKRLRQRDESGD